MHPEGVMAYACDKCFCDEFLVELIRREGISARCGLCDKQREHCLDIVTLKRLFEPLVSLYSNPVEHEPLETLKEGYHSTLSGVAFTARHPRLSSQVETLDLAGLLRTDGHSPRWPSDDCKTSITGSTPVAASSNFPAPGDFRSCAPAHGTSESAEPPTSATPTSATRPILIVGNRAAQGGTDPRSFRPGADHAVRLLRTPRLMVVSHAEGGCLRRWQTQAVQCLFGTRVVRGCPARGDRT